MDVIADLPADAQPPEPVQQRESLFNHPAVHAQAGTMFLAPTRDLGIDSLRAQLVAMTIGVVSPIAVDRVGATAGTATPTPHWRD